MGSPDHSTYLRSSPAHRLALAMLVVVFACVLVQAPARAQVTTAFGKPLGGTSVGLSWTYESGATFYDVLRSTDDVNYTVVAKVYQDTTQVDFMYHTDQGLNASTEYYYRVAQDGTVTTQVYNFNQYPTCASWPCQPSELRTPVMKTFPPSAPKGLDTAAGSNSVTLSWLPNPEPNLAGYNVYVANASKGPFSKANGAFVTGTSFTVSNLVYFRDYFFEVSAVDATGAEGLRSPQRWVFLKPAEQPTNMSYFPHGTFPQDTFRCAICHGLHSSPTEFLVKGLNVSELCMTCHDGTGARAVSPEFLSQRQVGWEFLGPNPGTGQTVRSDGGSSHPVFAPSEMGNQVKCTNCHNPHLDPTDARYPKMLGPKIDPNVSGTAPTKFFQRKGNEVCFGCHGEGSRLIGGPRERAFNASIHNPMLPDPPATGLATASTQIKCLNCHQKHGSPNNRLKVYEEENLCFRCHSPESGFPTAPDIFDLFQADYRTSPLIADAADMRHDIFDADQTQHGSKIECTNCHNPHRVAKDLVSFTDDERLIDPHSPSPNMPWIGANVQTYPGYSAKQGILSAQSWFCLRCHDNTFPTLAETYPWAPAPNPGNNQPSAKRGNGNNLPDPYNAGTTGPNGHTLDALYGAPPYSTFTNVAEAWLMGTDMGADKMGESPGGGNNLKDPRMTHNVNTVAGNIVVNCLECHDPHGTNNPFNLRTMVYSEDKTFAKGPGMVFSWWENKDGKGVYGWGYDFRTFCTTCHVSDMGTGESIGTDCTNCHGHGGDF